MTKIGALEAGGTKMVLAVYDGDGQELERLTIPTEAPEITMPRMTGFFRDHAVDALGVGSFGPLDLNPDSPTYGSITTTPKLRWRNYPIMRVLGEELGVPVGIDTDVNAAALGEAALGCTQGLDCSMYITVGTGIGVGINAMLSRRLGEGRRDRAEAVAAHGVVLYLLCWLLFLTFGLLGSRWFMTLYTTIPRSSPMACSTSPLSRCSRWAAACSLPGSGYSRPRATPSGPCSSRGLAR